MEPLALLGLLVVVWALLHLWLLPLVRDHWRAADMRVKMLRAGLLVSAEKLRDLVAVGALSVATVLLVVALANLLGGSGVLWPKAAIEAAAALHRTAKAVAEGYGSLLATIGLVGAAIALWLAARQARQRVAAVWTARAQEADAAFREDPARIDAAREDPELRPIVEHIDGAIAEITTQQAAAEPDKASLARARSNLNSALSALAIESARRRVDFPAAAGQPTADEAAAERPAVRRWLAALASERLGRDLGLIRKPLGWVVTGLLVVSLVGWAAEPLATSLQVAVNNLRIQLVHGEAQRSFDEALSAPPAAAEEPAPAAAPATVLRADASRAAARLLARAAVHELARAPLLDRAAGVQRAALAESEFVRAALAEQQHLPSGAANDAVARLRAETATRPAAPAVESGPAFKHFEDQLHGPLQQLQQRQPARLTALLQRLEARYGTPLSPIDAQGKLTARLLDDVFGALDAKPDGELAKQAQKLGKDFGKEAVKTWANAAVKQFVADALTGAARADVARAFAFEISPASREFITSLAQREMHGWQPTGIARAEARAAGAVAAKVGELHADVHPSQRELLAQRLGGYERLFPPDVGPLPAATEPLPSVGGGGGGGGNPRATTAGPARAAAPSVQSRSTSFRTASRSFRVRGVLIGQDLQGQPLDITDLRWQLSAPAQPGAATRVLLEVRLADKPLAVPVWRTAGSFQAGVLNQALRYAADRRVVATTITGGDGKAIGRLTYLHPALVDTPLGCRVVEADRWVDTFTMARGGERLPPAVAQLAADRQQMYRWLGTIELGEGVAGLSAARCPLAQVQELVQRRRLGEARFSAGLDQALTAFVSIRTPAGSERLLRQAGACAARPTEAVAECLCGEVKAAGLPARYWFPEDHTSQVRERAADIAANLQWLRPSADRLAHLDFWTHTTFSLRDAASGASDETMTAALDFPPAQLAALRTFVAERLPRHLAQQMRSTSYDEFMAPLEELVLAQRFARAALGGQLGRDFPLRKLIDLEQQTRRFVAVQPTIRWEPVEGPAELLQTLAGSDAHAAERFKAYVVDQLDRARNQRPVCDRASG